MRVNTQQVVKICKIKTQCSINVILIFTAQKFTQIFTELYRILQSFTVSAVAVTHQRRNHRRQLPPRPNLFCGLNLSGLQTNQALHVLQAGFTRQVQKPPWLACLDKLLGVGGSLATLGINGRYWSTVWELSSIVVYIK